MKFMLTLALSLLLSAVAHSQTLRFVGVDPQFRLMSDHGLIWRLAGIEIVEPDEARQVLLELSKQDWTSGKDGLGFDRWGVPFIVPTDPDGQTLQSHLLDKGLALCRPDLAHGCNAADLVFERRAREARTGYWELNPVPAEQAQDSAGRYALIQGRVLQAQEARRYVYLNFGELWKTDFTIRVPLKLAKNMAKSGMDLLGLKRRYVEVRGFVFEENGPMIELREAAALEVLE